MVSEVSIKGKLFAEIAFMHINYFSNARYCFCRQRKSHYTLYFAQFVTLGSVYETVVANELIAHGYNLFYYDNRSKGEVDYLIDDYESLSTVPIEVKSGKDYTIRSALNTFVSNEDYHIQKAFVLSNERIVTTTGKITYLPIYYVMFFENKPVDGEML